MSGDSSTASCESCNQGFEFEIELSSMFLMNAFSGVRNSGLRSVRSRFA